MFADGHFDGVWQAFQKVFKCWQGVAVTDHVTRQQDQIGLQCLEVIQGYFFHRPNA